MSDILPDSGKPLDSWTEADIAAAYDRVADPSSELTKSQVEGLWRYWQAIVSGTWLFGGQTPEVLLANVRLLLHVHAYELAELAPEPTPPAPAKSKSERHRRFCCNLLHEHRQWFERCPVPLLPKREGARSTEEEGGGFAQWGPAAALSPESGSCLDSPTMDVWAYFESHGTTEQLERIMVVGQGLPELRSEIHSFLIHSSLQMHVESPSSADMNSPFVFQLDSLGVRSLRQLRFPVIGSQQRSIGSAAASSVQGELNRVFGALKRYAAQTGLLKIHKVRNPEQPDLRERLRELAEGANEPVIWSPSETEVLVDAIPYWNLGDSGGFLHVSFSADLLHSASLRRLVRQCALTRVRQVLADICSRWERYQQRELLNLEEKRDWDTDWQEAVAMGKDPATECENKRTPFVTLNSRFDSDVGRIIMLDPPDECPTRQWFEHSLPGLLESYARWRRDMEKLAQEYVKLISLEVTPMSGALCPVCAIK